MEESRLEKIERIIDRRIRPSRNFKDKPFFKCDICWTCRFFNTQISGCCFTFEDGLKRIERKYLYDKEFYIVPTPIKDPLYYRCSVWEEGM